MPVTAALLEDRINQYINAVDGASAAHDAHQVSQLQKDIQQLVDLMERVNSGHTIPESVIPPPLVITPPIGFVPNPMNELASRLSNYHKALYFAEEELSEKRMQKIQRLQQGLQILNDLQRNVEAGYPVNADEIPPPVPIPSDDEFDNNAVETISERISSYKAALLAAEQSTRDRKHIPKLQSAVRTLEFLMTRAKANRPVWKRDIPPEYEYHDAVPIKSTSKMNKTKFMLMLRAQLLQVGQIKFTSPDNQQKVKELHKKLSDMEKEISAQNSVLKENEALLTSLTKQTDELEKLSIAEQQTDSHQIIIDSKVLVEMRIKEYMASALAYKKNNQVNEVLKLFKIVKTLRALKESLENGEPIDLSLIPPPLTTEQQTEQSSSAAADLSPVIIKPVIETEEDRLAKKLSQYLELGDEGTLYGQKSSVSKVNLNQAQTTGVLPKIPNALRNVTTQSSTDSLIKSANHTNSISLSTETNCEHPKSFDEHICNTEDGPSLDIQNGHLQVLEVNKSISLSAASHLGHPQSTDIYTRKTLDSVGFLPCQNVPEHEQVKVMPLAAVNAVEDQSLNTSVPLVYPESSQMSKLSDSSILGLSELNFQQPDCTSNVPSSLNFSVAHSEDFVSSKFFSLPVVLSQSVETLPDVKSQFLGPNSNTVTSTDKQLASSLLLQNTNQTLQLAQSTSNKVLQSENINSKVQTFYNTSNESSEFQDLMDSMVMPTPVTNAPAKLSEASMTHIEMNANVGSETTLSHSFTDTETPSKNIENSPDLTYAESRNSLCQKDSLSDNKNFTFQKYIPSVTSADQPSAWLNSNISLDNTIKNSFLTQSQDVVGSQRMCSHDNTSHTEYDSLSSSVEFTCIENLKYDFLIKEAKESVESQEEALSLRHRFEEIKKILLTGSIEIWEEYKSCVESELASFIKQIETLRVHHRWSEMRILSEKKQIAERELAILRERLPELKI